MKLTKEIIARIAAGIAGFGLVALSFAPLAHAQVFSQNQLLIPPFGSGVIVSTSTANGGKLQASSSPSVGTINATSSSATSSLPHLSTTQLKIAALSGFLKAVSGYIQTALVDLTSDVTGLLPVANGGTASSTLSGILVGNLTNSVKTLGIGSGLTFDGSTLSASGGSSGTISTSTPLANGQVDFSTGVNTIGNDSSFFWDNTNKRLGIGTSSPWAQLSVNPNGISGPAFAIGSSTGTKLIVTNGGSVGIGTAAPTSVLHVLGDTSNDITLNLQQANTVNVGVEFSATGGGGVWNVGVDRRNIVGGGANTFSISNGATLATTPRFIIGTTGNVGIGTTSPYAKLSVSNFTTGTPGLVVDALSGFTGNLADFKLASSTLFSLRQDGVFSATGEIRSGSTAMTTTGLRLGNLVNALQLGGVQGSGSTGNSATAEIDLNGISQASTPGVIQFRAGTASVNNQNEVGRFDASGDFGVGTTSPYKLLSIAGDAVIGASTAGGTLGDLYLPKLGTAAGSFIAVDANGKVIATTTPSGASGVTSVSNSDSTLTVSPTSGAVVASLNLAHSNTWGAFQAFNGNASTSVLTVGGAAYLATTTGTVFIGTSTTPYQPAQTNLGYSAVVRGPIGTAGPLTPATAYDAGIYVNSSEETGGSALGASGLFSYSAAANALNGGGISSVVAENKGQSSGTAGSGPFAALRVLQDSSNTSAYPFNYGIYATGGVNYLQNASSSVLSATLASFGGTATSSFSTAGALTLATPLLPGSGGTGATSLSTGLTNAGSVFAQVEHPSFGYATSSWSGTTTLPLGVGYGQTWNSIQCWTDVGTVFVDLYHGSSHTNLLSASTTIGSFTLSTNTSVTASDKMQVDIGTPASSPTKVSCTVKDTL